MLKILYLLCWKIRLGTLGIDYTLKKKQGKQNSEYNNSWIQHQLYLTDINESRWTAQWLAPSVRLLSCSEWKSTLVDLHKKGI